MDRNKVVLGLSGGVDSTAAALLLKKRGLTVVGLYFDVNGHSDAGRKAAEHAADQLGIEFVYRDVSAVFREKVIADFIAQYQAGRTPNPCVVCNPNVKFKVLADEADRIGAYHIATGHYAGVCCDSESDSWCIRRGVNGKKDQSYMLCRLSQDVIKRLILPLGDVEEKAEMRSIARAEGLDNAEAKDSQEICFIDGSYVDWLLENGVKSTPGDFVDKTGDKLGRHSGIIRYTVGQRKGLGVTFGKPVFVTHIDASSNQVVLGENSDLMARKIEAVDNYFVFTGNGKLPEGLENSVISAKIRYAAPPAEGIIQTCGNKIRVIFNAPQRAATPGQTIAYYVGDRLIGGGFIDRYIPE